MQFENLLTMVASLLIMTSLIYLGKHPPAKGRPLDQSQRLMMIPVFLSFFLLVTAGFLMFARPLSNLLIVVAVILALPAVVYMAKHPPAKGEPFDRTHKLMMIPFVLSFCCMVAAGYPMLTRP